MIAFHGDEALRQRYLGQLRDAIDRQAFLPDGEEALRDRVSVITALIGSRDIDRFEADTGISGSLGLLVDDLLLGIAGDRRAEARAFVIAWFAAFPKDDPAPVAARFAIWLLDAALALEPKAGAIRQSLEQVRALHRARAVGEDVPRTSWATARNTALKATDDASTHKDRQAGELAAGLAWPADRSRAVLAEGCRTLCALRLGF